MAKIKPKTPKESLPNFVGEIKTVSLTEISPNPFRPEGSPFNEETIQALVEDFKASGIWPNVLGRGIEKGIQLAYGHHRIEAMRRIDPKGKCQLLVADLSDSEMVRAWIAENGREYKTLDVAQLEEQIQVATKFLIENPKLVIDDLIKPFCKTGKGLNIAVSRFQANGPGRDIIARFLKWPLTRTAYLVRYMKMGKREVKKNPSFTQIMQEVAVIREKEKATRPARKKSPGRPRRVLSGQQVQEKILDLLTEVQTLIEKAPKKLTVKNFAWTVQYNLGVMEYLAVAKWKSGLTPEDEDKIIAQAENILGKKIKKK